jgi:DNA-directed RNA polymerase subunit M/transcription elongation factor TFIIS
LDESLCAGIDIADYKLPLSTLINGAAMESSRFVLPLATARPSVNEGASTSIQSVIADALAPPAIRNGRPRSSEGSQRQQESRSRSPPLDLTKKTTFQDIPISALEFLGEPAMIKRRSMPHLKTMSVDASMIQPKTVPSPPTASTSSSLAHHPKNYACPKCGVAFSSSKTLEGHQAYYCKANKADASSDHPQSASIKDYAGTSTSSTTQQTFNCQYCDHSTTTVWQLLQHMKTSHSLGAAYICTLCGYRGFSMRGMKSHLKHAHAEETMNASATTTMVNTSGMDEDDFVSKFVRRTKLFDEFDASDEPDVEERSHSSESHHSEIVDVDTTDTRKSDDGSPNLEKSMKKITDRKQEIDGASQKSNPDAQSLTSGACPQLISKFACQFCAYKSPYKGNVKRHLALVHKMERQTTTID